jgi:glucose/arabinose dehydrogenase
MRHVVLLATLFACGDNRARSRDAPPVAVVKDARPDAPIYHACATPTSGTSITWRLLAETVGSAMIVASPPNDPRLFVVEQEGRIDLVSDHHVSDPFLDISDSIISGGELGLLGLVFHPDFANNGTFYVFYTTDGANVLTRYKVSSSDPTKADPASATVLLSIPDFATNHNAGMLEFGPDGYLYISTGDGGGGGDPHLNGQNKHALLGKFLRIDVDHTTGDKPYAIPPDNPYADGVAGEPEVFMYGVRNPWRWAFDKQTGDMWIGDVGQDALEEIDMIDADTGAGRNLGWSMYEADSCYNNGNGNGTCSPVGITMPQFEQAHTDGSCAIIGGDVYRGSCYPDLAGTYTFTDYCRPVLRTATKTGIGTIDVQTPTDDHFILDTGTYPGSPPSPSSIHSAGGGEMYMTTVACCNGSPNGGIFRLEVGSGG